MISSFLTISKDFLRLDIDDADVGSILNSAVFVTMESLRLFIWPNSSVFPVYIWFIF